MVLKPLQERHAQLAKEKTYIDGVIKANAEKASYVSNKTLSKVKRKIGYPDKIR